MPIGKSHISNKSRLEQASATEISRLNSCLARQRENLNWDWIPLAVVLPPPARGPGTLIPSAQRFVWASNPSSGSPFVWPGTN